ncbi:MAG: UDP-3-O-[3-hydroxymyristoyl] N-acetylglucosamine deacetylase [Dictyoglomus sp. NZ13-RE01]|nr:MAG: UDP-3-O-[3-hydroxymyristoyl] N-acetylglucosamine deacetylase [Dictyoglomus sp. NZ13-RE01]
MEFQRTIKREITIEGVGLHTGKFSRITLIPSEENKGIIFIKNNCQIPALADYVVDTKRNVSLGYNGIEILTIEHLLSALYSLRITNLYVLVEGDEIPILDGSSFPWIEAIKNSGIEVQKAPIDYFSLDFPLVEKEGKGMIILFPSNSFKIHCVLSFPGTPILWQRYEFFDLDKYEKDIAPARTFGFWYELEELEKNGLIKGASLENAVLVGKEGYVNKERFEDEPVRHKILDIIGDFCLLGRYLNAHIFALSSGHTLHIKMVRRLKEFFRGSNKE